MPPKPPKRGILKGSRINISNIATVAECTGSDVVQNGNEVEPNHCEASNLLVRNTLQNEVIAYQNIQNPNNQERKDDICSEEESLFQSHHYAADSLTDTTNSSFATPPFSLSPIGESQGFSRWRSSSSFEEQGVNLSLPEIVPLVLPEPRELTIQRQPPPRNDFGFSLRRGTIIDRCINGSTPSMKAVIFAEPGAMIQNNNDTGLLPGDRLIGVNGLNVEDMSREEIIDLIKKCPDYVSVKVAKKNIFIHFNLSIYSIYYNIVIVFIFLAIIHKILLINMLNVNFRCSQLLNYQNYLEEVDQTVDKWNWRLPTFAVVH